MVPGDKPSLPFEEVLVSGRLLDGVGGEYHCFVMAAGGLELVGCFELNEGIYGWRERRCLSLDSGGSAGSGHFGPLLGCPARRLVVGEQADCVCDG